MLSTNQKKLLKKYNKKPLHAEKTPLFQKMVLDEYIDSLWINGVNLYKTSEKGKAELNNAYKVNITIAIAAFSALLSIIAIVIAAVK